MMISVYYVVECQHRHMRADLATLRRLHHDLAIGLLCVNGTFTAGFLAGRPWGDRRHINAMYFHASRLTPHASHLTPHIRGAPRVPGSKTSCTRPRVGGRSWAAWTPSSHGPRPPVPWVPSLGSIPAGAVTSRGDRECRTIGCHSPLTPPSLLGTRARRRGCRSPSMWDSLVRAASTSTHSARPCSRPFVRVRTAI